MFGACLTQPRGAISSSSAILADDFLVGPCTTACAAPVISNFNRPPREHFPQEGPTEEELRELLAELYFTTVSLDLVHRKPPRTRSPDDTSAAVEAFVDESLKFLREYERMHSIVRRGHSSSSSSHAPPPSTSGTMINGGGGGGDTDPDAISNQDFPGAFFPAHKLPKPGQAKVASPGTRGSGTRTSTFSATPATSRTSATASGQILCSTSSPLRTRHFVSFLTLFQHAVKRDVLDLKKPATERKYQDVFDGVTTGAINQQLIKDIPRAEWTIQGEGFSFTKFASLASNVSSGSLATTAAGSSTSTTTPTPTSAGNILQSGPRAGGAAFAVVGEVRHTSKDTIRSTDAPSVPGAMAYFSKSSSSGSGSEQAERSDKPSQQQAPVQQVAHLQKEEKLKEKFQSYFIEKLESFLLDFSRKLKLTEQNTIYLLKCISTQMCQCGLANLDRGSYARKYLVSGANLDQRTVYSLSTDEDGKSLKLTLLCVKTNFTDYYDYETLMRGVDVGGGGAGMIASASLAPEPLIPRRSSDADFARDGGQAHYDIDQELEIVVPPKVRASKGTTFSNGSGAGNGNSEREERDAPGGTSGMMLRNNYPTAAGGRSSSSINADGDGLTQPTAACSPDEIVISPLDLAKSGAKGLAAALSPADTIPAEEDDAGIVSASPYLPQRVQQDRSVRRTVGLEMLETGSGPTSLSAPSSSATSHLSYHPLFCNPPQRSSSSAARGGTMNQTQTGQHNSNTIIVDDGSLNNHAASAQLRSTSSRVFRSVSAATSSIMRNTNYGGSASATAQGDDHERPLRCKAGSYLYQYATLRFTPLVGEEVGLDVRVVDGLDEVNLIPE